MRHDPRENQKDDRMLAELDGPRLARERMVERQLRRRGIVDERVLAAMASVPRERFVPPALRALAYRDRALPIAAHQTISQPYIVAMMAELLELRGHERVLEVGTGSGYGAAVLARCAREVLTVERHPELAATAAALLEELGVDNVEVRSGDGTRGASDRAPFDAIAVTAAAQGSPPEPLLEQLEPGGWLVCPVETGEDEWLMRFRGGAERSGERVAPVRFVPLVRSVPE